ECLACGEELQVRPVALLERVELAAEVDAVLARARDVVEEVWAPEDDRSRHPALFEGQLAVASRAVPAGDDVYRRPGGGVDDADREQIDSRYFQPRRLRRDPIGGIIAGHVRRRDLRLLDARRPEP